MTNYVNITIKQKTILMVLSLVACIYLPMLFHYVGMFTGTGKMLAEIFTPMHIPVIICGFISGPICGFISGLLDPLISSIITGMPKFGLISLLMSVELSCYGLTAGIISGKNVNSFFKLLIIQFSGRFARFIILFCLSCILKYNVQPIFSIFTCIPKVLPGIVLQFFIILKFNKVLNKHL